MWVARDKSGDLCLFAHKPVRCDDREWIDDYYRYEDKDGYLLIDNSLYPDLSWNDEPIEVGLHEINLVNKVVCKHCGKEIKLKDADIQTGCDCQPGCGYSEDVEYIICPECGEYIKLSSNINRL